MFPNNRHALCAEARDELLGNILPFWRRYAPDGQHGGFIAELSHDLRLNPSAGKGLILNARILWTFSAAWRFTRSDEDSALAHRAFEFLNTRFLDPEFGGYFWELDPSGSPVNRTKKIYGQAFCIYALSEFHRSFNEPDALAAAKGLFDLVEEFSRDPVHGGYVEALSANWEPAADLRLSEKDLNEKKSMNNHLHVLEAYTSLLRIWPDIVLKERLGELLRIFFKHILDSSGTHLRHFFDDEWNPRSDSYTFGHDIEASWLLCEAADVLGDPELAAVTRTHAITISNAVLKEGLDEDGGLFYEGRNGAIIGHQKEWWPQAEAVVGFLNSWQITGEAVFLNAAARCWRFIRSRIVDPVNGEWFWAVSREGLPDLSLPKISMWKCPYHNARACLEIIHRTGIDSSTS